MTRKKPNKSYVRVCKRCSELYKTIHYSSKICPDCSRHNQHIKKSNSQIKLDPLSVKRTGGVNSQRI